MNVKERIETLRKVMKSKGIDACLIGNNDKHSSEYVNAYFKERSFISGFDGSAGDCLIEMDKAKLWTDGRYFLQAEMDLKDTGIELMKIGEENVPRLSEYIMDELCGKRVALNGEYFSYSFVNRIKTKCEVVDMDLVDDVWTDKDPLITSEIWGLELGLSGETSTSKLERVREEIKKNNADALFLSNIDDIAWLYNLRGGDVPITPVFLSFAYVDSEQSVIFLNQASLTSFARGMLNEANTYVMDYDQVIPFLKTINSKRIMCYKDATNYSYVEAILSGNTIIDKQSPTRLFKAIKNETEIRNNIDIHIPDGLAVFRFMKYAKENYGKVELDEYGLALKALEYRQMDSRFYEVSFDSICSWNSNGAIVHYEPTEESSKKIEGSGLLLLDSGGQYMGGTTDITRTISLGEVTEEMKHHYTLVLKAHIAVSKCRFLKGTTGIPLDMLARDVFWKEGLNYNHGTGHGIGYMLNVHEAPNGIRYRVVPERFDSAEIVPGMIQSIEPGIYLSGKYGIRTENEIMCVPDFKNEYGEFYKFQTLTVCPYDLEPLNVNELTDDERKWLNDYHKDVYNKLSLICDKDELDYLKYMTREI